MSEMSGKFTFLALAPRLVERGRFTSCGRAERSPQGSHSPSAFPLRTPNRYLGGFDTREPRPATRPPSTVVDAPCGRLWGRAVYNRGETCGYLWDSAGDNHGDESWDRPLTCEDVVHRLWKKEICPRNRPFTSGQTTRVP